MKAHGMILGSTGTPTALRLQQVPAATSHLPGYAFSGLYARAVSAWTGIQLTDQSVAEGRLSHTVMQQVAAGNDALWCWVSRDASVATLEMHHLASLPAGVASESDRLSFVLLGN